MKYLLLILVFIASPLAIALSAQGSPSSGESAALPTLSSLPPLTPFDASLPTTGDVRLDWILSTSLRVAHEVEPRNPNPLPMPRALAETFIAETLDPRELVRLTYYSFVEGSYSLDPHLPGDCKGHRAGTPKCTARLLTQALDAGREPECCSVEGAQHYCTLQVQPMPRDLKECVHWALTYMRRSLESYTASASLAHKREGFVGKLLVLVPPPASLRAGVADL